MAKESIGIGIDLGTTTYEGVIYYEGKFEAVKFERITQGGPIDDSLLIDSIFCIDPVTGEEQVSNASNLSVSPENYITEVKTVEAI